METSLRKKNIIILLNDRSLTGKKINKDVLFNKNTHCLICCERLISCFYMRSYGNFCKSCGYAAFNNPLGDEDYFSNQFFWNY